jgi:hypothetical protein
MKYLLKLSLIATICVACKPTGDWPPSLPLHPSLTGEATFDWWTGVQKWPVSATYFPRDQDSLLTVSASRFGQDNQYHLQNFSFNNIPLWLIGDTLGVHRYERDLFTVVSSTMYFVDHDVLLDSYDVDTLANNWVVLEHWDQTTELAEISFDLHYIRRDLVGSQPAATRRVHFADGYLSVTVYR